MYMKTDKEFDDFLKNRFEGFESSPPKDSWEKIAGDIKKKPSITYKKGVAGILLLAIISGITFFYVIPDDKKDLIAGENYEAAPVEKSKDPYDKLNNAPGMDLTDTSGENDLNLGADKDSFTQDVLADQGKELSSPNSKINDDRNESPLDNIRADKHSKESQVKYKNEVFERTKKSPLQKNNLNVSKTANSPDIDSLQNHKFEISNDVNLNHTDNPLKSLANENHLDSAVLKSVIAEYVEPAIKTGNISELMDKKELDENQKQLEKDPSNALKFLVYFSPRYTLRRIIPNTEDDIFVEKVNNLKGFFGERLGYEAGLIAEKPITKKWSINVGLSFIAMNEKLNFHANEGNIDSVHLEFNQNNSYSIQNHYQVNEVTYKSKFYYTGVSLGSSYYYWKSQRKALYFSIGGGVNLLVKGRTETVVNDEKTSTIYFPSLENPLEQMNFRVHFSPGYAYQISSRMQFILEPTLNYYLGSTFNEREPIGIKPYTVGLNMGIKF